jgi:hypothetical protein
MTDPSSDLEPLHKGNDMDYYEEPSPYDYGWVREEDLPNQDNVRDQLSKILKALSTTGDVDVIEDCMENLCGMFDVRFDLDQIQIERKGAQKKKDDLMQWVLGYQHAQIDLMNHNQASSLEYMKDMKHG